MGHLASLATKLRGIETGISDPYAWNKAVLEKCPALPHSIKSEGFSPSGRIWASKIGVIWVPCVCTYVHIYNYVYEGDII